MGCKFLTLKSEIIVMLELVAEQNRTNERYGRGTISHLI